jgi:FSR family fosmidomycin resistance protein-like MFS transporter
VDEVFAGVPTLGAPDVRAGFGLGFTALAVAVLAGPALTALVVEAPLFLVADRIGRRRLAVLGFLVAGSAGALAGLAPTPALFAIALAVAAPAGGCALGLVQAAQMDADPERRELWMTRWTLGGALGDLASPALLAGVAAAGLGWRAAFVIAGAGALALAGLTALAPRDAFGRSRSIDPAAAGHAPARPGAREPGIVPDPEPGPREARPLPRPWRGLALLRRGPGARRLVAWSLGVQLCDLLDEILVVVAALYLREVRGVGPGLTLVALALLPAGGALGLVLTERMLRRTAPLRLLALSAPACALALIGFATVPWPAAAVALTFLVGLGSAPFYPLAKAQAYHALPEDSALVVAVDRLLSPLGVAFPLLVASAASAWGLQAALLLLLAEPVGLFALAVMGSPRDSWRASPGSRVLSGNGT